MVRTETPVCEFGRRAPDLPCRAWTGISGRCATPAGPRGLLVMFICNHCPYVKAVRDRILRDARELKDHGIHAVAISSNDPTDYPEDSFDTMKKIAAEFRFSFPYLYDETQAAAKAFGAVCTPDFFGYNADLKPSISRAARRIAQGSGTECAPRSVRSHETGRPDRSGAEGPDPEHGLLDQVEGWN